MSEFLTGLSPGVIWLFLGVILLILEIFIPGLILFFFGVGAFLTGIICFFIPFNLNLQLSFFLGSSLISLFFLRKRFFPLFKGFTTHTQSEGQNYDDFIGKRVIVTKEISKGSPGKVELNGVNWNAQSSETISEGDWCVIISRNDLILKVEKSTGED